MPLPRIYLSPPHLSGAERALVGAALDSNWVAPCGPELRQFEERMCARIGVGHAVALASGTAALHLALRHLKLKSSEEVICSTLTFCASANPIVYEQANPVFLDSDAATWNLDPNLLEEELRDAAIRGQLPRAIVVVDIFGQPADMDALAQIAGRYEIPIIEDAAEALGSTYKNRSIGRDGWCSVFSFNGNKIITTGGGGMLCSDDASLVDAARYLATQARDPAPHYEHSQIGFNYRLSNLLAAVGLAQLDVLDDYVRARRRVGDCYRAALSNLDGISFMPEAAYGVANRWLSVICVDSAAFGCGREELRAQLESANIESRPVWKPLHMQPVFQNYRRRGGAVAERLFAEGLCLPSGSAMTDADLERVIQVIRETARPARRAVTGWSINAA
jgi:dTDP-4-amino-4,6-dideoxygalactose transaminase